MKKRALLVGINYPRTRHALRGCINDVSLINKMITEQFGFNDNKNKRILLDDSATTVNMLSSLEWLVEGAKSGDVLFFHYSGHGSQVVDMEQDLEDEPDGLDEILVPIDNNFRDKVVKDDDLRTIFSNLPDGVNLTVLLDCCHSGSGIRGGLINPYLTPAPVPNMDRKIDMPTDMMTRVDMLMNGDSQRGLQQKSFRQVINYEDQKGILISGCMSNQTSADAWIHNTYQGACTYFLHDVLRERDYSISYSELVKEMNFRLARHRYSQRPELNCSSQYNDNKFLECFSK